MEKNFIFYNRYFWASQCLCLNFNRLLEICDVTIRTRSRKAIDTGVVSIILYSLFSYIAGVSSTFKKYRSLLKKLILLGCLLPLNKKFIFLIFEKLYNLFLPHQIQSEWTITNTFNIKANKFYFRIDNCKSYEGVNNLILYKNDKNLVVSSFVLFIMVTLTKNYFKYISAHVICQWFTWKDFQFNYVF